MSADSPGASSSRSSLAPGDRIGPDVVLESIGSGGMGEVYRARDSRLERDVALKRLLTADVGSEETRARVLREARAAATVALSEAHDRSVIHRDLKPALVTTIKDPILVIER